MDLSKVNYLPNRPAEYDPPIGLIACGGITLEHLAAYKQAGLNVVALCDVDIEKAESRREEFYPNAKTFDDYHELLKLKEIEVVDIATHTEVRPDIIRAAINSGRHVLSQKPFVNDLAVGQELVDLAESKNVTLSVNQNGRWAPHFSFMREMVTKKCVGRVASVHCNVNWDHSWTKGTKFETMEDLVLYDFAIHWFDFVVTLFPNERPKRVYATTTQADFQPIGVPMFAQAMIEFESAQATLVFNAFNQYLPSDRTIVVCEKGTIESVGKDYSEQTVKFESHKGLENLDLKGKWFPDGFLGTMCEHMSAIHENRESKISGRDNLKSLELCFAAVESSRTGQPVVPGSVTKLPESNS